jgi:hypothetical protein
MYDVDDVLHLVEELLDAVTALREQIAGEAHACEATSSRW